MPGGPTRRRPIDRATGAAVVLLAVAALLAQGRPSGAQPSRHWAPQRSGTIDDLKGVYFADPQTGFAVGAAGTILATTNGGESWTAQFGCAGLSRCDASSDDRVTADLHGVTFPNGSTGFAVGAGGTILTTTDGGRRWTLQFACHDTSPCQASSPDRITADLQGVGSFDGETAYAVGAGGTILATTDGGRRWNARFACPERALSGPAHLATRDTSCTGTSPDRVKAALTAVSSPDPSYAFAVGEGGVILRTEDGGRNWLVLSVCAEPPCAAVGSSALQVRDGQLVYAPQPPGPMITADLTDVGFTDTRTGRAAGEGGTILSTLDGGLQWTPEHACASGRACPADSPDRLRADLLALAQPDRAHARAVGRGGIAITSRPPAPWTADQTTTIQDLEAVSFPDANTGYAVGAGGTILKYVSPPPNGRVERLEPTRGFTAGGTAVLISGSGLSGVTAVNFGGVPASGVRVESDSRVTAVSPMRAPGPADVTVTTPAGSSSSQPAARFTYVAPGGGSWQPTAPCERPCAGPSALLADGKVLVAGAAVLGDEESHAVEVYDPVSGTWTATAPLHDPRVDHTVTALHNGRVLVVGGRRRNPTAAAPEDHQMELSTAEIYDPASRSWRPTAPMTSARRAHTATPLADGRVLVVGGCCGTVDVRALTTPGGPLDAAKLSPFLSSAVVYDPASDAWSPAGEMTVARVAHTATLLPDGRVLVAGGSEHTGPSPAPAELYDPATNEWTRVTPLGVPRASHTATLLADGKVLVTGGSNGSSGIRFSELFDPRTGMWSSTGNLAVGRHDHTATRLRDGRVLVVGGALAGAGPALSFAELYDAHQGRWELVRSLPVSRSRHSATLLDTGPCGSACGRVLVVGGSVDDVAHLFTPPATDAGQQSGAGRNGGVTSAVAVAVLSVVVLTVLIALVLVRRRTGGRQPSA